ncbi:MAG: hypothetical protein ABW224_26610 [Kibdelosporangium sp.]
MTDPLTPPPWRTIHPDVRTRIIESAEEPEEAPRRRRALVPLAAGLAVLAIGAVLAIQGTDGGPDRVITPNPALDRCAAAVPGAPSRSEWEQAFESFFGDFKVIALRVVGKPVFCEVTPTAVTVSTAEPAYLPGTGTGLVMTTQLGTIAGVVDPSWAQPRIRTGGRIRPPTVVDGLFVAGFKGPDAVEVADEGKPWAVLPAAGPAPVTVVDALQGPAPDRTSGRGKLLGDCVAAATRGGGVIDPDSWEPGAMAESGDGRVIVTRNAYGYSSCWYSLSMERVGAFGRTRTAGRFYQADPSASRGPAPKTFAGHYETDDDLLLYGVVPPESRRVQIVIDRVPPIEGDVAGSTFAVLLPRTVTGGLSIPQITYRLYNASGQLTYEGPAQA